MKLDQREVLRRRLQTASAYLRAGQHLGSTLEDFGPTKTILGILAFEILLKALVLAEGNKPDFGHNYLQGWQLLDPATQSRLVADASERFAGHSDFGDMTTLLRAWARTFTHYRYDYEVNETRTLEEIKLVTQAWDGSPETADFVFYPLELQGLTEAIQATLSNHLTS